MSTPPPYDGFNLGTKSADTDILGVANRITWPSDGPGQLTAQVGAAAIVKVKVTRGSEQKATPVTITSSLNDATALGAAAPSTFDLTWLRKGDLIDFQVDTEVTVDILSLREIEQR